MLELSIRRNQSNFSTVYIFVICEEEDCYRDFSIGQLGQFCQPLNFESVASVCKGVKQIIFSEVFLFLSREV